eukprot:gene23319-53239_t
MKKEGAGHFGKGAVMEVCWDLVHDNIMDPDAEDGALPVDVQGRRVNLYEKKGAPGIDERRFCIFDLAGRPCGDMPSFEDEDTQGVLGRRSTFGRKETKAFQTKHNLETAKGNDKRWIEAMDRYVGQSATITEVRESEEKAMVQLDMLIPDPEPTSPKPAKPPLFLTTMPPTQTCVWVVLMTLSNIARPRPPTPVRDPYAVADELGDADDDAPPPPPVERVRPAQHEEMVPAKHTGDVGPGA